jgi:predicted permease
MTGLVARLRLLRRHAGHTIAVVVSLSIGMTMCVAVFTVVSAVVFAPIPGMAAKQTLVRLSWNQVAGFTPIEFDALDRDPPGAFASVAAQGDEAVVVVGPSGPVTTNAAFVSSRFFETLGTQPVQGRLLHAADTAGGAPSIVVGETFWRGSLNGRPDVIGSSLTVGDRAYTIVGVVPARMPGLAQLDLGTPDAAYPQVWLTLRDSVKATAARHRQTPWLTVAGRLRAGHGLGAVRAEIAAIAPRLAPASSFRRDHSIQAWTAAPDWWSHPADALMTMGLFMFLPLVVLAIGCVNVVNLQLARAVDQAGDLSLRVALGASRWVLVGILSVDVIVLSSLAGVIGWLGGCAIVASAARFLDAPLAVDRQVVLLVIGLVATAAAITGLLPAWFCTRDTVADGLRLLHHSGGVVRTRARRILVTAQLAGSLPLLALSGLAAQSLLQHRPVLPPDPDRLLLADIALADVRSSPPTPGPFIEAVLDRLRGEPAVATAAFATFGAMGGRVEYSLESDAPDTQRAAAGGFVTPGWFDATGARVLAGRAPATGQAAGRTEIAINAGLAAALGHQGIDALGRELRRPGDASASAPATMTIVGVLADTQRNADGRAVPMIVLPMPARGAPTLVLVARVHDTARGREAVQRAVVAADPAVPVRRIESFAGRADQQRRGAKGLVALGLVFGGLALTLAALGLYSLLAYAVRRRTREVGIRLAIGAERRDIVWLVVRQAVTLAAVGSIGGLFVAVPLTGLMRSVLVGIGPFEPLALLAPIGVLIAVSVMASAGPAFRAASIDPIQTLREP